MQVDTAGTAHLGKWTAEPPCHPPCLTPWGFKTLNFDKFRFSKKKTARERKVSLRGAVKLKTSDQRRNPFFFFVVQPIQASKSVTFHCECTFRKILSSTHIPLQGFEPRNRFPKCRYRKEDIDPSLDEKPHLSYVSLIKYFVRLNLYEGAIQLQYATKRIFWQFKYMFIIDLPNKQQNGPLESFQPLLLWDVHF